MTSDSHHRPDPSRPGASPPDPARPDPSPIGTSRPDPHRPDDPDGRTPGGFGRSRHALDDIPPLLHGVGPGPLWTEQMKAEHLRSEQQRIEQQRADQMRAQRLRAEQFRAQQVRMEQSRMERMRNDEMRGDIRHEPLRGEPGRPEPLADFVHAASRSDARWEQRLIADLLRESINERKRARRWRIASRLLMLLFVLGGLAWAFGPWHGPQAGQGIAARHTAVIDLRGVIDAQGPASAEQINRSLRAAFGDGQTAGVVLRINSPGGSPVQSGIIRDEMVRLRKQHPDIPLLAVVEEICASGAYYVAAAADKIYVDKASLIGSIGVLMDGFGFTGLMEKLGIERRLLTAGANKGMLDPFTPLSPEHRAQAQSMLDEIHRQFIDVVKQGRGARLKDSPELFSGLFWTGQHSLELGIADEIGSMGSVTRDVLHAPKLVDFTRRDNVLERMARQIGTAAGEALARNLRMAGEQPDVR